MRTIFYHAWEDMWDIARFGALVPTRGVKATNFFQVFVFETIIMKLIRRQVLVSIKANMVLSCELMM